MNPLAWILAIVLAAAGSGAGGVWWGKSLGKTEEAAKRDAKTLEEVGSMLDSHKGLIAQANKASIAMRKATALRQEADSKSTKEFTDALALTAGDRAGCRFPADSMRQLAEAQRRAAEAAASGIRSAMPTTDAVSGRN